MKNFKNLITCLPQKKSNFFSITLGFGLSVCLGHSALADDMQNNAEHKSHWQVGFDALYLQTNSIGSVVESVTYSDISSNKDFTDFSPDAGWGLRTSISYYFDEEYDLSVNWTHYSQNSVQNIFDNETAIFGVYNANIIANSAEIDNIKTTLDDHFDAVNIEVGQKIKRGKRVDMRVHAGLQYADITQTVTQKTWNSDNTAIYDENTIKSQFDGIGPRFGLDSSLHLGQQISFFGNVAGTLLMGNMIYSQSEIFTVDENSSQFGYQSMSSGESERTIVMEAEAKLGVRYTQRLNELNSNDASFNIEVGYEIANYWDAVILGSQYTNVEQQNFGYDGIFFGMKYMA